MPKLSRYNWREPPGQDRKSFIYDADDDIQTIIGDPDEPDFTPEFSIDKWGEECKLKIRIPSPPFDRYPIKDENEKISLEYGNRRYRWYIIESPDKDETCEALEWEIEIDEPPSSNEFIFPIETENLRFEFQPPLTQAEIDHGCIRPEDVVGSYVLYHETKTHNKYKTGQIGIIYKPKIVDSNGDWIWCALEIDTNLGQLKIIIPQSFLDTAIYPLILDPTFGYNSIGASQLAVNSTWCYCAISAADKLASSSGYTLTELHAYIQSSLSSSTFKMAYYKISGTDPSTKQYETVNITATSTFGWRGITGLTDIMPASTDVVVAQGEYGSGTFYLKYNSVATSANERTGSTLPANWTGGIENGWQLSMYGVYDEGGVTVTPAAAAAVASKADPTVILGSLSITPSAISAIAAIFGPVVIEDGDILFTPDPASAIAGKADPNVILGSLIITPTPISSIGATFNPTVILGSLSITPDPILAIAGNAGPTVILGSLSLMPTPIAAIGAVFGPTVIEGGGLIITPAAASAIASGVDPSVILGSVVVSPGAAAAIASASGPITIYGSLTITPDPATAVGTTTGGVFFFAIQIQNISYGNLGLQNESSGGLKAESIINKPGLKGSNVITGSGD